MLLSLTRMLRWNRVISSNNCSDRDAKQKYTCISYIGVGKYLNKIKACWASFPSHNYQHFLGKKQNPLTFDILLSTSGTPGWLPVTPKTRACAQTLM